MPLARAIKGDPVSDEIILIQNPRRPSGIFIEVSASPIKDNSGALNRGTSIVRDISTIRQVEVAQEQSEAKVSAQFNGFPIPTYVWQYKENDFVLIDYNIAAEKFTSGKVQKFIDHKLSHLFADSADIQANFLRCYTEKSSFSRVMTSYRLRCFFNRQIWIFIKDKSSNAIAFFRMLSFLSLMDLSSGGT